MQRKTRICESPGSTYRVLQLSKKRMDMKNAQLADAYYLSDVLSNDILELRLQFTNLFDKEYLAHQ